MIRSLQRRLAFRLVGSFASSTIEEKELTGLLRFLMEHRHGTPYEHGAITFNINAPIFVWREFHRHRIGFSYSEESGRYKTLEPLFYLPKKDRPMMKVDKWKAGRPKFLTIAEACQEHHQMVGDSIYNQLDENLTESYQLAYTNYLKNLDLGIDPGLARDCLPVGIYSSCWVTCNPRSLMAFLSLRTHDPEAAKVSYPLQEIEMVARQIENLFAHYWPVTYQAFCSFGRVGP